MTARDEVTNCEAKAHCQELARALCAALENTAHAAGLPMPLVLNFTFAGLTNGIVKVLGPDETASMFEEIAATIRAHKPQPPATVATPPQQLPN